MARLFFVFCSILVLAGCANTSADYYKAVQEASEANARSYTAKMTALAQMAANGDPSAQGAAVMAMALSQPTTIAPQYIESQALSWARVLATPVAAVTGLYLQTDLAKHQSDNTARVQLGQQSVQINSDNTNSATILGVSQQLSNVNAGIATSVSESANILSNLGVAGFTALSNQSTNAVETVGGVAVSGFDSLNTAGSQTVEAITSTGNAINNSLQTTGTNTIGVMNALPQPSLNCTSDGLGNITCN